MRNSNHILNGPESLTLRGMRPTRVLVVDDHEAVRKSICALISTCPTLEVCAVASDGRDAIEKAMLLHPDVVLMDLTMPTMGGLEATREIKRQMPETTVLIVSQHDSLEVIRQAMTAGASGYVAKSRVASSLVSEIEKATRRLNVEDGAH